MKVKLWVKTPKFLVLIAMAACLLIASVGTHDKKGLINAGIAAGVSMVVDIICSLLAGRKRILPDGAVITGLIIALILSTTSSWWVIAATAAISILSKHLLVHRKRPIFNPAAFGLLLSIPILSTEQSWWGAFGDLPAWTVLFLLIGGYIVTNKVHKYPQIFSFFATFFTLLLLMGHYHIGDATDALRPPFINAAVFFGFFMLTDPPTSPAKIKHQIIFGIFTALVGNVVYALFGGLMYLFIGLLAGNLYQLLQARASFEESNKKRTSAARTRRMPV